VSIPVLLEVYASVWRMPDRNGGGFIPSPEAGRFPTPTNGIECAEFLVPYLTEAPPRSRKYSRAGVTGRRKSKRTSSEQLLLPPQVPCHQVGNIRLKTQMRRGRPLLRRDVCSRMTRDERLRQLYICSMVIIGQYGM
jgi:hypothetical protein